MDADKVVRKQLLYLLNGGNAHMSFDEAVDRFPLGLINTSPPNVSTTPWQLLEHIRISQWDILEFTRNPAHISPAWPEGYWPPSAELADQTKWENTIGRFRADLRGLQNMVEDNGTDLYAPLPHAREYSVLREILVLADHNAYHMGEFALLRQIMKAWPADHAGA